MTLTYEMVLKSLGCLRCTGLVFVLLAALNLACWGENESAVNVRLNGPVVTEDPEDLAQDQPIRFVLASVVSPELSTLTYARFASYLTYHLGRRVEIVRRRTYSELNELLRNGSADAGIVCTGAYAEGRESFGLRMLMVPVVYGATSYRAYVIARSSAQFESIDDLQGAVFAFSDPLSNSGYRYVADLLLGRGLTPKNFFGRAFFTYSHDNTIQAVRDGIADAGVVDSLVWDQLVISDRSVLEKLRIVQKSEAFPINPVVVSPKANTGIVQNLKRILIEMPSDPVGREALADLGISGFSTIPESRYDPIVTSWKRLGVLPITSPVEPH